MSEVCTTMSMDEQKGFTLVELLITMVVVSVLLATAVPSLMQFVKNNRLTGQTNDLVVAIQMARSEAVKRGTNTVICASSDQVTCTGNTTWASGWIVYSDFDPTDGATNPVTDGSTPLCAESEDCIIRSSDGLSGGNTITMDASNVRFLPTGFATNGNMTFSIKSKDCYRDQKRNILITAQGHTIVTTVECTA
jgi:type IV fimbrial biogenesis protein FimT